MGQVIKVNFGVEREWEETHAKTVDGLVCIGSLFGDDEKLMRAKAECVSRILRQMVEEVPSLQLSMEMPENLPPAQVELLTEALKEAAFRGIEVALTHSVQAFIGSVYDLCTSKLAAPSRAG
jgi:hypothetical protein